MAYQELLKWVLALLMSMTQPNPDSVNTVRIEPTQSSSDGLWYLVCYEGCSDWSEYAPASVRQYGFDSRSDALDAYILIRAWRFQCEFSSVREESSLRPNERCLYGFIVPDWLQYESD